MEIRRSNNLIILLSAILIITLLILSQGDRERRRAAETPVDRPTAGASLLTMAIELMLSDEGMIDSLDIQLQEGHPDVLSPAESLFVRQLAKTRYLPADSVRAEYLRIRARVFRERSL